MSGNQWNAFKTCGPVKGIKGNGPAAGRLKPPKATAKKQLPVPPAGKKFTQ